MVGYLILNGRIYGNDERSDVQKDVQRGWSIYCSKRRKNGKGCGKSYSLLFYTFIKGFTIQANSLWKFLKNILLGMNKHKAYTLSGVEITYNGIIFLWNKFINRQPFLRTMLLKDGLQPKVKTSCPAIQTIHHLKSLFKNSQCPISDFQYRFQCSFF